MRKLMLQLLSILPVFAFAQSIEVKYSVYSKKRAEVINKMKGREENQGYKEFLSDLSTEKRDSFCLVVKGRMSSFERLEPEEELSDDRGPRIIIVGPAYSEEGFSVYKNFEEMSTTEQKDLLARTYSIKQALPRYQWKVGTETKKIMGLQVCKATIGDSITAWFCPSVPVQDGPGLYCGLPGLILDLEDRQTIYSCTAINTISTREVGKAKKAKEVTAEEFEELRKRALRR